MTTYLEPLKIVGGLPENPMINKELFPCLKDVRLFEKSFRIKNGVLFFSIRQNDKDLLVVSSPKDMPWPFQGVEIENREGSTILCEENRWNSNLLVSIFPDLEPSPIGKEASTFGVGDRLGSASIGHINSFSLYPEYIPILAQQSLRELQLTGRTYREVIDASVWGVFKTGYRGLWGADGDHLKDIEAAKSALEQGCTMITADLSDFLDSEIEKLDNLTVLKKYKGINKSYRERVESFYGNIERYGNDIELDFSKVKLARIVLVYKKALEFAQVLYRECSVIKESFDFEISVDETAFETSLEAHYFIACELRELNILYTGIAPRYVGEFQKGIDYIGDLEKFRKNFSLHAKMAKLMGHKISIHSSSDKFSVYPIIKEMKEGPCHLKTSGTNWLVALQVIAATEYQLFRDLFDKAYEVYDISKTYYHVTPDWSLKTKIGLLCNTDLYKVFSNNTDRQVLHVSYGEIKKSEDIWGRFQNALSQNQDLYNKFLERHIGYHLFLLS